MFSGLRLLVMSASGMAYCLTTCFWMASRQMDVVTDSVQQVRLAQSDPAIQKQWVVGLARWLGHRQGGSESKVVVAAYDEGLKRFPGVKRETMTGVFAFGRGLRDARFHQGGPGRWIGWGRLSAVGPDFELDGHLMPLRCTPARFS
jgi:hypothetical protein